MARSRHTSVFGTCRLCSEDTDLSFEHVPPQRAFNGTRARGFGIDDWLKDEGKLPETGGQISQRGLGAYTLCAPCNNKTGAWYTAEYVQWAVRFWESLDRMPQSQREGVIWVRNRYPLRFLKQACTMFFSANAPRSFAARHSDLVRFVLNKESRQFPPDIDMCLALYRGPLARVTGATGKLEVATRSTEIVSEVAYPPFALRLISNSGPAGRLGSISHFSNYGFGNRADLSLTVVVGEGHTPYPGDYRTKEQVLSDARKSRN
jgi:hypothetical protein